MRVPAEAAGGYAKITLSIPDWEEGHVAPATLEGLVLGGPDDAPALRAALEDASSVARPEIVQAIGRHCTSTAGAADILIDMLGDRDDRVRREAVNALRRFPQAADKIVPALIGALDDSDLEVAIAAAGQLGQFKDRGEEVLPPLLELLRRGDDRMRWTCAPSLYGFEGHAETVVPALIGALDDPVPSVRTGATEALCRWGEAAAPATERLLQVLQDPESVPRNCAVDALRAIAGQQSVKGLMAWVRQHHAAAAPDLATAILRSRGAEFSSSDAGGLQVRFGPYNAMNDGSVGLLAEVAGVKEVSLAGTRVGDPGLAGLRDAPIEVLDLSGCEVTDAAIQHLARLPSLRVLHLEDTRVTAEAAARLRAQLPGCKVITR